MEESGMFEYFKGEDGKEKIKISKVPLESLLNILENLYEQGVNFIDFDFSIDPNEDQSVISISTRPEYIATPEELEAEKILDEEYDDEEEYEDEEDDVLSRIRKEQEDLNNNEELSDEDLNELI